MRNNSGRKARLRTTTALAIGVVILAGNGSASAQSSPTTTFNLTALSSGTWSSAGIHTVGGYQIGHSNELPDNLTAYFEFDLTPAKGRTLVSNAILIPGSTDYQIGTIYAPKCGTLPCFKVGITPQGPFTTAQIVSASSNNNKSIYLDGDDPNRNQDLGYAWPEDGLHLGLEFDADHYAPSRLQTELNAGGAWVFFARDEFDTGESGTVCSSCPGGFENYIWGKTVYNTGIVEILTVENGPATTAVVANGTYQIKNLNSGAALQIPSGHTTAGALTNQSTYTGGTNQQWKVTRLSNGNYTIASVNTGLFLDVFDNSDASGAAVDVWTANGQTNQEWTFTGTNDANYIIKSVKSGLLLNVSGALTLNGTAINQLTANGVASQQWSFVAE